MVVLGFIPGIDSDTTADLKRGMDLLPRADQIKLARVNAGYSVSAVFGSRGQEKLRKLVKQLTRNMNGEKGVTGKVSKGEDQ